ncbi:MULTISPECIES: hypothetical protein [Tenacibaculum]|uniref:hypothetical protein n=1 Tax=Tenacibaculum TaxID=104267 RepID=UPI001BEBD0A3|nr:hypothetical protein [Tenacibaculum finnmarkense]MCD8412406.1 hypothetical protein [Tenacibaculum finnmarkense genomovar ulcerans]MCD8435658.1 hypothetical protein [Tenacibaculum dicentrarchi]MCD8438045.1 hypothetical protein [Tenacibaculum dicentrarchi]MCD8443090.1 hypothetical protein [Tenacibaculum dicentrarchi]
MKYTDDIRAKELDKLKKSNYFDEDTIKEIRSDFDMLTDEELEKNKIKIEQSTKQIIEKISINDFNYYNSKLAFS